MPDRTQLGLGPNCLSPRRTGETTLSLAGSYTWDLALPPALHDIALTVPSGSLVAVVGPTGSGKVFTALRWRL